MSKAEQYIKDSTRNDSNRLVSIAEKDYERVISYREWLTPDAALEAVRIAREEVIERACEWLKNNVTEKGAFSVLSFKKEDIESFKQAMEKGE
jgi:hypothetical protein